MSVRAVGPDWVLAHVEQLAGAYRECFTAPPWSEAEDRVVDFADRLVADVVAGAVEVLVATAGQAVAGFAVVRPTRLPLPAGRAYPRIVAALGDRVAGLGGGVEVDELAVRPSARGSGLGRALLTAVSERASGRCWLITAVHAAEVRAFYRRAGWTEVATSGAGPGHVVVLLGPDHPDLRRAG